MRTLSFLIIATFFLNGCALVGPDYVSPDRTTEDAFNGNDEIFSQGEIQRDWWMVFGDQQLESLIAETLENNPDLKVAGALVREARSFTNEAEGNLYPQIDNVASARQTAFSETGTAPASKAGKNEDVFAVGFDSSWELDVFGSIRRRVEAANARVGAALEFENDVRLILMSEVARNYFTLRGTQRGLQLTEENVRLQKETARLTRKQLEVGTASELDVSRAQSRATRTEASVPALRADIRANAYALSVLTGRDPEALLDQLLKQKPLPPTPDVVPLGLRSEILRRRPDIRQAERELAASNADIGVATADLFPRFFLTGSAGFESLNFGSLFEGNSFGWSLGPSIRWPVFTGGAIRARIRATEARTEALVANYESTVLSALQDVETALIRYGEELKTRKILERAARQNRKTVRLSQERFDIGDETLLSVIDAQREQFETDELLAQSETRVLVNLVSLYKALGGGWGIAAEVEEPNEKVSEE